jgi:hypothetical protein
MRKKQCSRFNFIAREKKIAKRRKGDESHLYLKDNTLIPKIVKAA